MHSQERQISPRPWRRLALLALVTLLGGGLVVPGPAMAQIIEGLDVKTVQGPSDSQIEPDTITARDVIARISGRPGNFVDFEFPDTVGDEPSVLIVSTFPEPPLVDPDFAATSSTLRIFLAIAPEGDPVPAALLSTASEADLALMADRQAVEALRADHQRLLSLFEPVVEAATAALTNQAAAALTNQGAAAGVCSTSFKNWAKNLYGKGYGDTKTCTDTSGFTEKNWSTYYCDPGPGNDCSYEIAGLNDCSPSAQVSCSAFDGKLKVHRARHSIGSGYTYGYNMNGRRYRYGVAHCPGGSGNMVMWRKRGAGNWIQTQIVPNSMAIRVGGAGDPRPGAYPTLGVTYAFWKQVIPQGGSSYKFNQLQVNTQPGQRGRACGDVMRRFETYDITPNGCNFGLDFCSTNQSCSGACWQ